MEHGSVWVTLTVAGGQRKSVHAFGLQPEGACIWFATRGCMHLVCNDTPDEDL